MTSAMPGLPGGERHGPMLDRLRHLHLRARAVVEGLHAGSHRSIRLGRAVEFADYKPYLAGDSLRDLDWRVLARSDRLVVKRYRAETEVRATIVFDASADLGSTPQKWEQAVVLAATLAMLFQLDGAPFGLVIGAGDQVPVGILSPRSGSAHLARVLTALAMVRPAGRAGLDSLFRTVGERLSPRSLVAVVSDFMEEPASWTDALGALTRRRVDLRALHLYDRGEYELSFDRPLRLLSPETSREEIVDPDAMRASLAEVAAAYVTDVRNAVLSRRGVHQRVETADDLGPVLSAFLRGAS